MNGNNGKGHSKRPRKPRKKREEIDSVYTPIVSSLHLFSFFHIFFSSSFCHENNKNDERHRNDDTAIKRAEQQIIKHSQCKWLAHLNPKQMMRRKRMNKKKREYDKSVQWTTIKTHRENGRQSEKKGKSFDLFTWRRKKKINFFNRPFLFLSASKLWHFDVILLSIFFLSPRFVG